MRRPKNRRNRKAQTAHLTRQKRESIMFVKTLCTFVFGINHHGKHAQLGPRCTHQRITQEHATKALALVTAVDGKPSQQRCGNHRISWQFLRKAWRQIVEGDTAGRERVVAGYAVSLDADRYETRRDPPLGIL